MDDNVNSAPAVFLDRDGTLMEDVDYCHDPARVAVYPETANSLVRLQAAGFRLVLITNQSGIGRGYFTEVDYRAVHAELVRQLAPARLDAAYFCPDAPEAVSNRRKPAPGMVLQAARELGLNLADSYVVGDKAADVELATHAGLRGSILVLTGKGGSEREKCLPDFIAVGMTDATEWILRQSPTPDRARRQIGA